MATTIDFHNYIISSLSPCGDISTKRMMGEYILYFQGKVVGNICDNILYLKPTVSALAYFPDAERGYPYEGSKTLMIMVDEAVEDVELMRQVLEEMYEELPVVKPKKRKSK